MYLAYDYPLLSASSIVPRLLLLSKIALDMLCDGSLGGFGRTGSSTFVTLLWLLGVLLRLLARGAGSGRRETAGAFTAPVAETRRY